MFDVIVVGGGPAGSTAATLLTRKGHRVLLLEKERFPRFQIGESLLPYNNDVFRELGIAEELESAKFIEKLGATFLTGDGEVGYSFRFGRTLPSCYSRSFQVKREYFDDLLLKNAKKHGVDVREAMQVRRVDLSNPDRALVEAMNEAGDTERFEARFVVDGSGHGALVGQAINGKVESERLKKISVFSHYRNVLPDPKGRPAGDTVIVVLQNGWFWMIPVGTDEMSVGLVVDREEFKESGLTPEQILEHTIRSTPYVSQRMHEAERVQPVRARKDFSYHMKQLTGTNFALVGDAAGFIDPIFSTGVFMAMKSAQIVSDALDRYLRTGSRTLLRRYDGRFRKAFAKYLRFVSNFYTREFVEVFLHPSWRFGIFPVIIQVLAGSVFERKRDNFKLAMFFTLVRLQGWRGFIAPRIAWDRLPSTARGVDLETSSV